MAKVLLKRNFATPFGRFKRSIDGEPTEIPDIVLERLAKREEATLRMQARERGEEYQAPNHQLGLPRSAVVVGPDYKSPRQLAEEEAGVNDVPMTAAEMEEEILRRAEEKAQEIIAKQRTGKNVETASRAEEAAQKEADEEDKEEDDTEDSFDAEALIHKSVPDIVAELPEMEYEQIKSLLDLENNGKKRQTLIVQLEAAMDEFE